MPIKKRTKLPPVPITVDCPPGYVPIDAAIRDLDKAASDAAWEKQEPFATGLQRMADKLREKRDKGILYVPKR